MGWPKIGVAAGTLRRYFGTAAGPWNEERPVTLPPERRR